MGPAVGPVVALAILEGEGAVTRRRIEPAGRIGHAVHFVVQHLARAIQRQGQRKERSRRLGLGSRDGVVGQRVGEGFAHDFKDVDARPLVGRAGVGQQHKRLRGGRGAIQVVAQRVGAFAEQQRVFLVGIETDLRRVVLIIDAARLLRGPEIAGADARGDHDLRFTRRIDHRVAADLGRQEKRRKLRAGSRHFLEPPDRELVVPGPGVHWDDRPGCRRRGALGEGIDVSCGIIVVPAGNVTGLGITRRRLDAVTHVHRQRQVRHPIGVGVVDRGHRRRGHDRAIPVRIHHRRAAESVPGLDVKRHIPRRAVFHEFDQGPAGLVAAGREVCQQAPADGIDGDLGFRRIVLENHLRQMGGVKLRPRRQTAAGVGHRHRLIAGKCCWPGLGVFAQILRPLERQIRRGGDARVQGLQPVNLDLVGVIVFAFGVVNELAVGQRGGAIERLAGGRRAVERDRWNQIQIACRSSRLPRLELLAEWGRDIDRLGIALGGHHVGPEELAVARPCDLRAEVFHKHAAFQIVSMQGCRAEGVVEPQRAALAG